MINISNMHDEVYRSYIEPYLDRSYRISHSFNTRRSYKCVLNNFRKFLGEFYHLDVDELILQLKNKELFPIEVLDTYYTFMSKKNLKNRSIITNISVTKDFLNFHGMHIYTEDMKQKFRLPKPEVYYEEGLTRDLIVRLLHNAHPRLQILILLSCSSGGRLGELIQLRLSDIDFSTIPTTLKLRRETTKTRETRFVHITSEATNALKDYLRKKFTWVEGHKGNYFLFLNNNADLASQTEYDKKVLSSKVSMIASLRKTVSSVPELSMKNESGLNVIHFHAFRKWFKTQVTNAQQSDFAEALLGHKSLKLVYYKQSHEERREMYKQIEPFLTLTDFTKVEKTMDKLQEQVSSLQLELEKVKYSREIKTKYQN